MDKSNFSCFKVGDRVVPLQDGAIFTFYEIGKFSVEIPVPEQGEENRPTELCPAMISLFDILDDMPNGDAARERINDSMLCPYAGSLAVMAMVSAATGLSFRQLPEDGYKTYTRYELFARGSR